MLNAFISDIDNDAATTVRLTWMTRMLSPVSRASCSRIWRVGLGVAANAAFSVSSCLALIVVRGPRRLAPSGIAPPTPTAVVDAPPGLPAGMLSQSSLSSAKFSLSPLLLLLLLLLADDEDEHGEEDKREALTPQSARVGGRSAEPQIDVGSWRSTTQRVFDES